MVTWNLAGEHPPSGFDIGNLLISDECDTLPDLFIVGLQEMVKLNTKSVLAGKNREKVMLWEDIITRSLSKKERYVCLGKKTMVGCFIIFFARDEHKNRINHIRTSKVKTGLGGQGGNKGCVAIRFNYDDTSFAFLNCHLTSGQKEIGERLENLREIWKRSFDCSQKFQDYMI